MIKNNKFTKNPYFLSIIILFLGVVITIATSFYTGHTNYQRICNQFLSDTSERNTYVGLEKCDPNSTELFFNDPLSGFYITIFMVTLLLLVTQQKNKKRVWMLSLLTFYILLVIAQLLLNTFPRVAYEGWQDAGWTLMKTTNIARVLINFSSGSQSYFSFLLPIICILFPMLSLSGPFIASKICLRNTKIRSIIIFILLSLIIQTICFLITFPTIPLWFLLSWG